MIWQNLTSPSLSHVDRRTPVLLPLAAIEQHGPHLPLATDRLIGEYFAAELEREIPDRILILPSLAVGCSRHHMDFAGTLTLSHDTFAALAIETMSGVIAHGFHHLILLNSHGGNQGVGQVILERLGEAHPECRVVLATWWKLAGAELAGITESGPGGVGHACEFETSLIECIAPELIDRAAIKPGENAPTYSWAEGDMLRGARAALYRTMKQMTPNGVYGRPDQASREKGLAIRNTVVGNLKTVVLDLIDH
jgi:creatinine amidohydrolase